MSFGKKSVILAMALTLMACQSAHHAGQISDKTQIAHIRTQMAGQYILTGDLDEAKRQLDIAMAADAHFAPSYDMMAVLLQTEGSRENLARADAFFQKAIRLDRDFMRAYNNYGVYLAQMGRSQEAMAYFEKAGSALGYEGRIQALENLGFTWRQLGSAAQANEAFYRAIDGGSVNLTVYEIVLNQLVQLGEISCANAIFDKLIQYVPLANLNDELLNVGIDLAKKSNDTGKLTRLNQAIQRKNLSN